MLIVKFVFITIAGLLSALVTPVEMKIWANVRASFPKPVVITTIVYYGIFNVLAGPITEELFFRGYLTSHYEKQGKSLPIVISVLFSLYHFWLPFDNVFRILSFLPVYCYTYKKKNVYIGICFHCLCNLVSVISFSISVL